MYRIPRAVNGFTRYELLGVPWNGSLCSWSGGGVAFFKDDWVPYSSRYTIVSLRLYLVCTLTSSAFFSLFVLSMIRVKKRSQHLRILAVKEVYLCVCFRAAKTGIWDSTNCYIERFVFFAFSYSRWYAVFCVFVLSNVRVKRRSRHIRRLSCFFLSRGENSRAAHALPFS